MFDSRNRQVSELLVGIAKNLDLPYETEMAAQREYERLGSWLQQDNKRRQLNNSAVYPQGSLRLRTVVAPVGRDGEFDFDIVYVREIQKTGTTQEALKKTAKEQMEQYAEFCNREQNAAIRVEEKGRCITLNYPGRFHMDVLPAIPDPDGNSNSNRCNEHSLIITDRDLRFWLPANPKGYAQWFFERAEAGISVAKEFAERGGVEVEPIGDAQIRQNPLQRCVQLLKRHRDLFQQVGQADKPISILISTLAALAYKPAATPIESLRIILENMERGIEKRAGIWWVPNPVVPAENFAEKWQENPKRADAFYLWLKTAKADIEQVMEGNLTTFLSVAGPMFGKDTVSKTLTNYASLVKNARADRTLFIANVPKAGLRLGSGIIVPEHRFYGDVDSTP